MAMLRCVYSTTLALSLSGCATAPASPDAGIGGAGGGIARLAPEELARLIPQPTPRMPLAELVRMSKAGAAAKDLIARIKETGSRYELSASQMIDLHAQGVSAEVLDYIQSAHLNDVRERLADEINQREQRHAEELERAQERCREMYYRDLWWPAYPGYGWSYPHPDRPFGGFYWRR